MHSLSTHPQLALPHDAWARMNMLRELHHRTEVQWTSRCCRITDESHERPSAINTRQESDHER